MSLANLPEDILKIVFQSLTIGERLQCCALVCKKFHAAAVAATSSIAAAFKKQLDVDQFLAYLQQHGSQVTRVAAVVAVPRTCLVLDQLPSCQHLQELILRSFSLKKQLEPGQRPPALLDDSTRITRLELDGCLYDSVGCAALSVLVNLQHLAITDSDPPISDDFLKKAPHPLLSIAWSCLEHLTYLKLTGCDLAGQDLGFLGSIPGLAQLVIHAEVRLAPDNAPGFVLPATLRDVSLTFLVLGPAALAAATQLTRLVLEGVAVDGGSGPSGGTCFLEALSKLQHLEIFHVEGGNADWPLPSPAYSALLASSRLRSVVLRCQLPLDAPAHVFARSHKLELLEVLDIEQTFIPWSADDVASLARCCPALLALSLDVPTRPWAGGRQLSTAFSGLTSLTKLHLSAAVGTENIPACVKCLASLSRLRALDLWLGNFSRMDGLGSASQVLLSLSALRQLEVLRFSPGGGLHLSNKVWQQCWLRPSFPLWVC